MTIADDNTVEGEEQFVAELSVNLAQFPGVTLQPDGANVIVTDDDGTFLRMYV